MRPIRLAVPAWQAPWGLDLAEALAYKEADPAFGNPPVALPA